ncbi:MAG TPA: DUF971 domain-containing protein [Anaerolineales bacterium]|nr:DUF971 domain-containing protein [Anaerolineales bacterium]
MKPASITASRSQKALRIEWDDGHESVFPWSGLRAACPCAECRGGHENMGLTPTPQMLDKPLAPGQSGEMEELVAVGNYALQPRWKDGHVYGIYTWEYLRLLCPCGQDHSKE